MGWVLGRGPQPTAPSWISTGPSPHPCTTGTEPEGGSACPAVWGHPWALSSPRALTCRTALLLSLLELRGEEKGESGGPCRGEGLQPPPLSPAQPGTSPQGLLRPAPEVGAAPCHTSPCSPVTHAWSWGCSGAGVRLGWQLSCSHRSHYSSPSCHLLTLLSGASRQLRSAPSPAFINAHSRQAGAAAGGGICSGAAQPHGSAGSPAAQQRDARCPCCPCPCPCSHPRGSSSAGPHTHLCFSRQSETCSS